MKIVKILFNPDKAKTIFFQRLFKDHIQQTFKYCRKIV